MKQGTEKREKWKKKTPELISWDKNCLLKQKGREK